jgi:acetoin:2,6-dichlorophenolindophenol oxidoreductase subunit alpha
MAKTKTPPAANIRPFYANYAKEDLREALRKMHLIRKFEEGAEDLYTRGLSYGTMHLSVGQEASAVGATMMLRKTDYITSTHRGHGHCIGKGAEVKFMFAEFLGKEEGYCRGRGGSMHIADMSVGNLGANGIVGGGIPIAAGAAMGIKQQKRDDVVVCFFGDGASNEGAFHEALNMAAVWKLPVIFVCENNQYGMSVSTERSMSVKDVATRAIGYNMPGITVDGNSIAEVVEAVDEAVAQARIGNGPSLIECKTYRTKGHSRSDRNRYRTKEEIETWKTRDPIPAFAAELIANGILSEAEVAEIDVETTKEIEDGIVFAQNGTTPTHIDIASEVHTPPNAGVSS